MVSYWTGLKFCRLVKVSELRITLGDDILKLLFLNETLCCGYSFAFNLEKFKLFVAFVEDNATVSSINTIF